MTRLPRLLDANLHEVSRLHPISLSITEKLVPLSFASMYLLKDEMVKERQWVELFTPVGSAGIYRTRAPQTGIGSENYVVELDHGIAELGDYIIPDTIDKQMTCRAAITEIFKHYRGKRWKLGVVQCTSNVVVDIDYDNLLEAINDILDQTIDYVMSFNFTTSPWTLDIVHKETTVTAEGRLSRNVKTATIKSDDKDLCTRVYVKGLTTKDTYGFVDANTQRKYGLIEHVETGTGYTTEQARLVADHYLASHKEPKVSVEISAIELSQITGEELDKFRPGKLFRLAVPSHGITVEDVITSVTWSDVYGNPMEATVSLGDDRDAVLSFWQKQKSSGKATQKTGTKTYKTTQENKTHIEQTETYVDLYAAKTDLNGKILEQAGLYLDAKGIIAYAEDKKNGIGSRFKVFSDQIDATVKDINGLSASLTIEKGRIDAAVTDIEGLDSRLTIEKGRIDLAVADIEGLGSEISVERERIGLVVTGSGPGASIRAASIVASVNNSGSTVAIDADHVNITGNVKLNNLVTIDEGGQAVFGRIVAVGSAGSGFTTINNNKVNTGTLQIAGGGAVKWVVGSGSQAATYDIDNTVIAGMIYSATQAANGTVTLTKFDGTTITFSGTPTLTGSWGTGDSAGQFTVTAKRGSTTVATFTEMITQLSVNGTPTLTTGSKKWVDATIDVYAKDLGASGTGDVVLTSIKSINATAAYNEGWKAAGANSSSPITEDTSANNIAVVLPSSGTAGNTVTRRYYLAKDNDYFYLRYGSASPNAGTTVAQIANTVSVAGWNRTAFPQNTNHSLKHAFDIPIQVTVNGTEYSHTFTTPEMFLRYMKVGTVDTYELVCGSTVIYRFEV